MMEQVIIGIVLVLFCTIVIPAALYFFSIPMESAAELDRLRELYPVPDRYKNQVLSKNDMAKCHVAGRKGNLFLSWKYRLIPEEDGVLLIYTHPSFHHRKFVEKYAKKNPFWIPKQLLYEPVAVQSFWGGLTFSKPYYIIAIAGSPLRLYIHRDQISHSVWQAGPEGVEGHTQLDEH